MCCYFGHVAGKACRPAAASCSPPSGEFLAPRHIPPDLQASKLSTRRATQLLAHDASSRLAGRAAKQRTHGEQHGRAARHRAGDRGCRGAIARAARQRAPRRGRGRVARGQIRRRIHDHRWSARAGEGIQRHQLRAGRMGRRPPLPADVRRLRGRHRAPLHIPRIVRRAHRGRSRGAGRSSSSSCCSSSSSSSSSKHPIPNTEHMAYRCRPKRGPTSTTAGPRCSSSSSSRASRC